jgi:6-phosphogluconolactonase
VLEGKGEGIYRFQLDTETGALKYRGLTPGIRNPSYLTVGPSGRTLYAVNELKEYEGSPGGAVSAFTIDPQNGDLQFLNRFHTGGSDPCHVSVARSGTYLAVANFMSGSIALFSIGKEGTIKERSQFIQHHGSSVDPVRQKGPHAHSVSFDDRNSLVYVPDLGLDALMVYRFDAETGSLRLREDLTIATAPGSGPRHLALHADGVHGYLINELDSTVTVLSRRAGELRFKPSHTYSLLPVGFDGRSTASDIHLDPSGRWLYASNRGDDSIAVFAVDARSGDIKLQSHIPAGGKIPRNFCIDPTGRFMVVAAQDSDRITSFCIHPRTGIPKETGFTAEVPTPVCIKAVGLST